MKILYIPDFRKAEDRPYESHRNLHPMYFLLPDENAVATLLALLKDEGIDGLYVADEVWTNKERYRPQLAPGYTDLDPATLILDEFFPIKYELPSGRKIPLYPVARPWRPGRVNL